MCAPDSEESAQALGTHATLELISSLGTEPPRCAQVRFLRFTGYATGPTLTCLRVRLRFEKCGHYYLLWITRP